MPKCARCGGKTVLARSKDSGNFISLDAVTTRMGNYDLIDGWAVHAKIRADDPDVLRYWGHVLVCPVEKVHKKRLRETKK